MKVYTNGYLSQNYNETKVTGMLIMRMVSGLTDFVLIVVAAVQTQLQMNAEMSGEFSKDKQSVNLVQQSVKHEYLKTELTGSTTILIGLGVVVIQQLVLCHLD
ncbi:MAG: hypothetical protein H7196_01045 [candidate division SR1 bacterium]|nr:hypothetical protein [candidate division SR1 bacterium]